MAVDINKLADSVIESATAAIARLFAKKEAELTALFEKRLAELPAPKDGRDGKDGADGKNAPEITVDLDELAKRASTLIVVPVPKDGRDGADGKDADVEAIAAKAMDVVLKFLDEVPLPKDGETGRDGINGKDAPEIDVDEVVRKVAALIPTPINGKDGINGSDASPEAIRAEAERAVSLLPIHTDGRDGRDGKDGNPGRDALHLEIIPAIDESKVYPRNTFAKHQNGFWRSFEKTDGMKGWECLVAGIASIEMAHDGEREFSFKAVLSDGTTSDLVATPAIPLDRGVFRDGNAYTKGDGCTWGGSFWIAQKSTSTKPGEGDDWRLAVKRGRDGKDGEKGDPGIEGKSGKDLTLQDGRKH